MSNLGRMGRDWGGADCRAGTEIERNRTVSFEKRLGPAKDDDDMQRNLESEGWDGG